MKIANIGIFVKHHKFKMLGVALALVAFKSVADTLPRDPAVHLQRTFDNVEASLALSEEQAQVWAVAESATLAKIKTRMEQRKAMGDTLRSTLAEDNPDLHALSQTLLSDMETHLTENKANHDAWLNVYDNLNADQQALVRKALLAELTKMEHMRRMGPPSRGSSHGESSSRMRAPASSF